MGLKRFFAELIKKQVAVSYFGKYRFSVRLAIALPLIFTVIVFGFGIMYVGVFSSLINAANTSLGTDQISGFMHVLKNQMIGSVIISFLVGSVLAYAIILPLKEIATGVQTVSGGDLSHPIQLDQGDEIGLLGKAFNDMVVSLNKHMLNSMTGGVLTLDMKETVVAVNTTAELVLDCDPRKIIGHHLSALFPQVPENEPFYMILRSALSGKKITPDESLQVITSTGKKIALSVNTTVLTSQDNNLIGVVVNFRDIQQIKEEMRQTQTVSKLASLGTLAAGLAHEIRNPISAVRGMAELIREAVPEDDDKRLYADTIVREMDRLNSSVNTILEFAQPAGLGLDYTVININHLLEETLRLASHDSLQQHVSIVRDYGRDIPEIAVDKNKLQQAFLNIILNAFTVLQHEGVLEVSSLWDTEENVIVLIFKDSGPGINEEVMGRIFDPFFTTRDMGTGLGLSIAHQIVTGHRGALTVANAPDKGAVFTIKLPVTEMPANHIIT